MSKRPYVLLSVATSIDGFINDNAEGDLKLSNDADFDRVDQVRAESDALLIGAGTLRWDDPRIIIKSEERRAKRLADGKTEYPAKILVTASGDIDPSFRWFHSPGRRIIYTIDATVDPLRDLVGELAEVVAVGPTMDFGRLLDDLGDKGINVLMVEGGEKIHTSLISAELVDEIHFVVAPLLVGSGPRFLGRTDYPWKTDRRHGTVIGTETIGDVVLIRYRLHPAVSD